MDTVRNMVITHSIQNTTSQSKTVYVSKVLQTPLRLSLNVNSYHKTPNEGSYRLTRFDVKDRRLLFTIMKTLFLKRFLFPFASFCKKLIKKKNRSFSRKLWIEKFWKSSLVKQKLLLWRLKLETKLKSLNSQKNLFALATSQSKVW